MFSEIDKQHGTRDYRGSKAEVVHIEEVRGVDSRIDDAQTNEARRNDVQRREPRMVRRVVRIEDGAFNWSAFLGITGAFVASIAMWIGVVRVVAVVVHH